MTAPPPLHLHAVARALAAYPDLAPVEPLRVLDLGFGSVALETAGGLVVLVARDDDRPARYAMAARLLPALRGRLPLAVPRPLRFVPASDGGDGAPHAMLIYPKLPGRPLAPGDVTAEDREAVAGAVGRFLAQLHALPSDTVRVPGLPRWEPLLSDVPARVERLLPHLARLLTPAEHARVRAWLDALRRDRSMAAGYAPVLRHGDMWYGNLLADERGTVTAVIDWEDAALGDPAVDFADQIYLGRAFLDAVVDAYREAGGAFGSAGERRMRRWWESREFGGIDWAVRHGDDAELAESVEKLRRNPILAGW